MSDNGPDPTLPSRLDGWQIAACYTLAVLALSAGGVAVFVSENGAGTVALFAMAALFVVTALNGALPIRIRAGEYEAELRRATLTGYEAGEQAGAEMIGDVAKAAALEAGSPEIAERVDARVSDYLRRRQAAADAADRAAQARVDALVASAAMHKWASELALFRPRAIAAPHDEIVNARYAYLRNQAEAAAAAADLARDKAEAAELERRLAENDVALLEREQGSGQETGDA